MRGTDHIGGRIGLEQANSQNYHITDLSWFTVEKAP